MQMEIILLKPNLTFKIITNIIQNIGHNFLAWLAVEPDKKELKYIDI